MNTFVLFQVLFGLFIFSTREISGKSLDLPRSFIKEDLNRFESGYEWGTDPEEGPYFQGDVITTPQLGNGLKDKSKLWPSGIVIYRIDGEFNSTERSYIRQAMDHIASNCCVRFREKRASNRDYVSIQKPEGGCSSAIGKQGGPQPLRLSSSCFAKGKDREEFGRPVHEMLHALGVKHEHTRSDRDDYVTIKKDNIQDGTDENGEKDPNEVDRRKDFEKVKASEYSNYGGGYDYGSVMHYKKNDFLKKWLADTDEMTIEPTRDLKGKVMGQRRGLSELDVRKINNMYKSECN